MATETEKLYNESAGTATSPAAAATASPTAPVSTGNATLDNYNTGRVNQINQMYDAQRDAAIGQIETARNKANSDWQAAYEKITPKFQESRNAIGAEYERQRRNNNLQAQANGLNTGANSQMQLAASSVYQQNQAGLQKAENEALAEAERNKMTMQQQYDADIKDATAKGDAQRAAALLNEFGQQYDRMQAEAKQLAAYGDFSLYKQLYGEETANSMQKSWDLQNPLLAYNFGRLTADEYFRMTGKYPPGSPEANAQAASSGGGGRSYGYGGSGGGQEAYDNVITSDMVKEARAAGMTDEQIRKAAEAAGATVTAKTMADSYGRNTTPQAYNKMSTIAAPYEAKKPTPQALPNTATTNPPYYYNPNKGGVL